MPIYLATKTIKVINDAIKADQGARFRELEGIVLPHITDAYRANEDPFRSHMGASGIGNECARQIWYGFRWATKVNFDGQTLRLFNRGHLEEGRFIAMLLMIGCEIYQQDEEGKQFKISEAGGHFGGSGDGVVFGCPDIPAGTPGLLECKTSNEKSFIKMKKEGVEKSKYEHYVQVQIYMRKMGLSVCLYMMVNKNNDELYGEIVLLDTIVADQYMNRGINLVFLNEPPKRISESPGWYQCGWCDYKNICHLKGEVEHNCRTCHYSYPNKDGKWYCMQPDIMHAVDGEQLELSKKLQLTGCDMWLIDSELEPK